MNALDPYAAIRRLRLQHTPGQAYTYDMDGGQRTEMTPDLYAPEGGWESLGGFQSKYTGAPQIDENGVMRVTLQNPGMHKYDTLEGAFVQDPATGEWVLQGDPNQTRQVSSAERMRDFGEGYVAPMLAAVLGGGYAMQGLGAGAGAGAAAGEVGGAAVPSFAGNFGIPVSELGAAGSLTGGGAAGFTTGGTLGGSFGAGAFGGAAGGALGSLGSMGSMGSLGASGAEVGALGGGGGSGAAVPSFGGNYGGAASNLGAPGSLSGGGGAAGYSTGGLLSGGGAAGGGGAGGMGGWGNIGQNVADVFTGNASAGTYANLAQLGLGLYGQNKAAGAMKDAAQQANDASRYAFDTSRADMAPYRQAGYEALGGIKNLLANPQGITQDPGYQFGLKQGSDQIANRQAASGGYYSGGALKEAQRYGQDYAGTKLNESYNRLANLAGLGQVGATGSAQAAQNYGQQASNNALATGGIRGSQYMAGSNLLGSTVGNIFNQAQERDMYGNLMTRRGP